MKLKVRGALFRCGRCRKSYSNPFGHVCVARIGAREGKTRLAPKLTAGATCTRCGKPVGNRLAHTCTTKTDFRKRQAAAKKAARPQHPPWAACKDPDCQRTGCRAYREGLEYGYGEGFEDGMAACPLRHA